MKVIMMVFHKTKIGDDGFGRKAPLELVLIIKNEETNTGDKVRLKWTVKPRWYSDKQQMFYC